MDAPTRRRRAACAAFDAVLGEDDLLAALWMQHDSMSGDAVSDIIRFVDAVAERFAIDGPTRKRLYDSLYRALRLSDADLPIDPWPAMLAVRPAAAPRAGARAPLAAPWPAAPRQVAAPPVYEPPYQPGYAPVYPPPYAPYQPPYPPAYNPSGAAPHGGVPGGQTYPAVPPGYVPVPAGYTAPGGQMLPQAPAQTFEALTPVALPVAAATAPVVEPPVPSVDASIWTPGCGVPPEQAVFAELIASIAADIAQTHSREFDDWRSAWLVLLERQKPPSPLRAQLVEACRQLAPSQTPGELRTCWRLALPDQQLAAQVHQLYVALCEALGPVDADHVLNRAVKLVEQTPAARLYSPRKLM
ncbi:MAG: hypothetical protein RL375_2462 [Pseudomonadota bacterium]